MAVEHAHAHVQRRRAAVLAAVTSESWQPTRKIARDLPWATLTVQQDLRGLEARGQVRRKRDVGDSWWRK